MATSFTKHTFNHPLLGLLTGRVPNTTPGVTHFRSVPFATVPARFRQSVLISHIPSSSSRDFSEYGTACPGIVPHDQVDQVGGFLPGEELKKYDEFSCLNLTISAPKAALGNDSKLLPVMVYVHGGAFMLGAGHISAFEETTKLVNLSIQEGHPVIIVSIHYRLNWLGFLACQDLVDEAVSFDEPASNFGYYDQRTAFAWIKRHVSGFGGDPNHLTAFGESAGSISIATHMCSDVPLFNRAILMSGTPTTIPPNDLKYKELEYLALLKCCGIAKEDPERLKRLREVPVEKLIAAIGEVGIPMFTPLKDEKLFPRGVPNYWTEDELIAKCEWVDSVIIGDVFWEGFVLEERLRHVSLNAFISLSTDVLGEACASKILSAYEITPEMDFTLFVTKMTYLVGDLLFSEPMYKLASSLAAQAGHDKKKVYRYTMTARNPFPGTTLHQIPGHHFVDLIYLFGTLIPRFPTRRLKELSTEMGKRWVRFGAGLEPWEEHKQGEGEGKIMVISGTDGFKLKTRRQDEEESRLAEEGERRYAGWEAIGQVMNDIVRGDKGLLQGEEVRRLWGPDGGMFKLMGVDGPYGVVLP